LTLLHHWEFEGDFTDSVSDADGTAVGFADLTDVAKIGDTALVVNGSGDYVEVLDRDSLKFGPADSYTVATWVQPRSAFAGWKGIVTKGRDVPPWYGIWINPTNRWVYGTEPNNLAGPAITFDEWSHVAIVQNGPLGTRELYVNGLLEATEIARDANNFGNLLIGGAASVNEWFTGEIDDVRIYDVPLGLTQIKELASGEVVERELFHRGDANDDGKMNITDGIFILNWLFLGGATPGCMEAANANDAASINITTGIFVLNFLFLGGPPPPDPGPIGQPCGPDATGSPSNLGCNNYDNC
jgi:hypothetical protein